jgi:predicted nucleic acid-binding protein
MSDRYFLDTNVLIYSFDTTAVEKQTIAKQLIAQALQERIGFISYQVVQEFIHVASRKFSVPIGISDCRKYLNQVLSPLCGVFSSMSLYENALDITDRWRFGFYDSLIIASALAINCKVLYSEDLQDNQSIHGLTIKNPFAQR